LFAAGEPSKAREHAGLAVQSETATPEAIDLYTTLLIGEKVFDEAEKQLGRLTARDPDDFRVAELRAKLLAAQGKISEAATTLEKAFSDRAGKRDALSIGERVIRLLGGWGRLDAAERVARQVGKLGPGGALILAQYLVTQGQVEEAASLMQGAAAAGNVSE